MGESELARVGDEATTGDLPSVLAVPRSVDFSFFASTPDEEAKISYHDAMSVLVLVLVLVFVFHISFWHLDVYVRMVHYYGTCTVGYCDCFCPYHSWRMSHQHQPVM